MGDISQPISLSTVPLPYIVLCDCVYDSSPSRGSISLKGRQHRLSCRLEQFLRIHSLTPETCNEKEIKMKKEKGSTQFPCRPKPAILNDLV